MVKTKQKKDKLLAHFDHSSRFLLNRAACLGWLPYALLAVAFLSLLMLAPSVISTLGGVENPKLFATLTRSSLLTSKTERRECDA